MGDFKYANKASRNRCERTVIIGPDDLGRDSSVCCSCLKGLFLLLGTLTLAGTFGVINYLQFNEIVKLKQRVDVLENSASMLNNKVDVQERHARQEDFRDFRSDIILTKTRAMELLKQEMAKCKCSRAAEPTVDQKCANKRALVSGQPCCDALAKPGFVNNTSDVVAAYIGQDVLLPCNATGYPPPKLTISPSLDPSGRNRYTPTSDGLQIMSVKPSDGGTYTCTVENVFGIQQKQIQLLVTDPVVATTSPISVNANNGETFKIRCDVSGSPPPIVTWQHLRPDGVTVPIINTAHTILTGNTITVINATAASAGSYICSAQNQYEVDQATTTVSVTGSPEIVTPPKSLTVMQGETVTLYCAVVSNPPATVTWTYPLTGSRPPLNGRVNSDNSITLSAVDKYNNGAYRCEASNSYGTVYAQASLVVEKGVTASVSPHLLPMTGTEPVLSFRCSTDGDPLPTTTWSKVGSPPLAGNSKYLSVGGNLIITGPDVSTDTGIYSCYAENHIGNATDSVIVYKALGQVNCSATFADLPCSLYQTCGVTCPDNCNFQGEYIYGINTYSPDSILCMAAAHFGVLPNPFNDPVIWKHVPNSGTFGSFTQNGITSQTHGLTADGNQILRPSATKSSPAGNSLIG